MKFRAFIVFFFLLGVLPDLYITCVIMQGMWWLWRVLVWIPTMSALVLLPMIGLGIRYTDSVRTTSYVTFLLQVPKIVMVLFHLGLSKTLTPASALVFSLIPGIATSAFFTFIIFFGTKLLRVSAKVITFKDLPREFDGLRICQLSDLHLGSFGRDHFYVRLIMQTANSLLPDLICFTGDLVNFEASDADPYFDDLSILKAPLGVISIRGNHDYLLHGPHKGKAREEDMARLLDMEKRLGWKVLLDSNLILTRGDGQIAIVGVENTSSHPYFKEMEGDLDKALKGLPEGIFKILLSHDPSHWRTEVAPRSDIELTLSGHTHGLRYKIVGLRPSHWKLPYPSGVFHEGGQTLHVSAGLGSAFAFRLGGFPKIDLITLKSESNE